MKAGTHQDFISQVSVTDLTMQVEDATECDYRELIALWESSVRATHEFMRDRDICALKPLVLHLYFDAMELKCIRKNNREIIAFCGTASEKIEMLIVSPSYLRMGIGSRLCNHAIQRQQATRVDVNEQNSRAIEFFEHIGFKVIGRSALDRQGNAFPTLHMRFSNRQS